MNRHKLLSWVLLFILAFGFSLDADAQREKKKKRNKKKNQKVEQVQVPSSRILESDRSLKCEVFTGGVEKTDQDLARISQTFADMNLRRQVGDYGPGEFSAYDYWNQMYGEAPGFSILVYTDGSAIHREMAAVAQEEGDEALFKENAERALSLLDEGEKCYPDANFGPARAYVYEILYPTEYQKIFDLYTKNMGPKTDPYSLMSITRYALYMGSIGEISRDDAYGWYEKTKALAATASETGDADYEYALEVIDLTWTDQYKDYYAQLEEAENPTVVTTTTTTEETVENSETQASNNVYNQMLDAFNSNNLSVANSKFNEYIKTEKDPARAYDVSIYAASTFESAGDYPKARSAYQKAASFDSNQGYPYFRIGMMYISSGPVCGEGTGFDSQRVIWAAFDKFNVAKSKTLDADSQSDISSTMAEYKSYLPLQWQLDEEGLSNGQTYNVTCWINESTTVISNETYQ